MDSGIHQLPDGKMALRPRTKIIGFAISDRVPAQQTTKPEITADRFQHVLPRPDGSGVTHLYRAASIQGPDNIGNDPVTVPVAAADDITGTDTRTAFPVIVDRAG